MKVITHLAFCAFALGLCPIAGFAKDYVENGTLEEVREGKLVGWEQVYTIGEISQEQVRTGKHSYKLAPHAEKATGILSEVKGFKPGSTLLIHSHIYVKRFDSGILKPIHLAFTSQGKTYYRHINLFPRDKDKYQLNDWTQFTYELDLSEYPDVESIRVYCLGWQLKATNEPFSAEVYVDDISVVVK